ncbi:flagellar basal body rod protein [Bacillaceae bacterium Marseille-Q3522]|nr:flagellar basal body rod protein [Bacillaceae bacterium Marseille-Q3522]
MKKFGLFLIGAVALFILLSQLGNLIALAISLAVLYFVFKQFMKTNSTMAKFGWGIIGLIALFASASNLPALIGIAALFILYVVIKKWNNKADTIFEKKENDPFTNFERQWSELNK